MRILTPFAGEMLVLVMLVFLNARILFTRRTRHDALAILAPLSVIVMILQMLAWEIRFTEIVIFALALVTAILNYRSIVRFSQNLFVDSYSVKFFIASILLLLVSIFVLVVAIVMRPVRLQTEKYNVQVEREYFSCATSSEFSESNFNEANEISDKRNFTLYTFSNKNVSTQKNTIVLFVGDVFAETLNYEPYLILLARAGYTVLAADLYDDDFSNLRNTKSFRRSFLLMNFFQGEKAALNEIGKIEFREKSMKSRSQEFSKIYEGIYNVLASIAKNRYAEKGIFIVCDSSSALSTEKLDSIFGKYFSVPDARAFPRSLNLADIDDYMTPGFGFVSQTEPLFAKIFLGVARDETSFAPSYCVYATRQKMEN